MFQYTVSEEELKTMIREGRADLDCRIAAGEVAPARVLVYSRPRGPVIVPWPPGWGVTAKQRGE